MLPHSLVPCILATTFMLTCTACSFPQLRTSATLLYPRPSTYFFALIEIPFTSTMEWNVTRVLDFAPALVGHIDGRRPCVGNEMRYTDDQSIIRRFSTRARQTRNRRLQASLSFSFSFNVSKFQRSTSTSTFQFQLSPVTRHTLPASACRPLLP